MRRLRRFDPAVLAGLVVVWAAAWSAPLGQIVPDTKYDLVLDPWGFLGRALTLWDSQQNWGGLANQAYGYLFPMGPFFGVLGELLPGWAVQRLWWTALLTLGFIGAYGLLRALDVGSTRLAVLGALAWVLAPKVVSSFAVLSGEIHPHLLIPLILWPVLLGWRRRVGPWTASVLSGGAIVLAGGVNGAAVILAIAPTGLFLVTRPRWWRNRLTWTWLLITVLATAWWAGPLLFMARYSAPFLDWIESSAAVSAQVGLLDVVRGTTQWLGHLLTTSGPWWPGGYQLATAPWLIILTSLVSALGLCGLALRSVPLRGYLWTMLLIGTVAISVAHAGALSSPVVGSAQVLLDGPLAAFRNIHKADGLVRLPLVVGLVHLTAVLTGRVPVPRLTLRRRVRGTAVGLVGLIVVLAATPAFTGAAVSRGGHHQIPQYWTDLGAWLDENNADAASLVVPAANFGEYLWGRPLDEHLRALTSSDVVVRDAIPLVGAGSIRLLDEVERRLQGGRGLGGAVEALRDSGVRYLIVRNDLAADASGQPPVALARGALRASEDVSFVEGFGGMIGDLGERVYPLEVYELSGSVSAPLTLWPGAAVISATGASEDLPRLAEAGLGGRPVIFAADDTGAIATGTAVLTDGLRARETFFGAPRGADSSTTLTAGQAREVRDYRPEGAQEHLTAITYAGIRDVTASSSIAHRLTFAGLSPAMRPFAALNGIEVSGWLTMWDPEPTITVELVDPLDLDHVVLTPWSAEHPGGSGVSAATEVEVRTDNGSVNVRLDPGPTRIELPVGPTALVEIRITETATGSPADQLTGLADVTLPGVSPRERITTPRLPSGVDPEMIVLSGGRVGFDGCMSSPRGVRCLSLPNVLPEAVAGATYLLTHSAPGEWTLAGTLVGNGDLDTVSGSPDVQVSASSSRSLGQAARPENVVDGDRSTTWSPAFDDPTPELVLELDTAIEIREVSLRTSDAWAWRNEALIRLLVGGQEFVRTLPPTGRVSIPPTLADRLVIELVPVDRSSVIAGMELTEVVVNGRPFAPPAQEWKAECGLGPVVTVNGEQVPTEATVTRAGRLGLEEITWRGCDPVGLFGVEDEIEVSHWHGLAPGATILRTSAEPTAVPEPLVLDAREHGQRLTATLPPGDPGDVDRLLVLNQNASEGWRAVIDGAELRSQVVDGRRQGFVVPAGVSGDVQVSFGPERLYRPIIIVGLTLALAVLLGAAWHVFRGLGSTPPKSPVSRTPLSARSTARLGIPAAAVGAALLIAGLVGGLAAGLGWLLSTRTGSRARLGLVVGLVVGSAAVQALVAPASSGPAWLEGGVRVALLLAIGVAAAGATGDETGDRQFEELVAEEA